MAKRNAATGLPAVEPETPRLTMLGMAKDGFGRFVTVSAEVPAASVKVLSTGADLTRARNDLLRRVSAAFLVKATSLPRVP